MFLDRYTLGQFAPLAVTTITGDYTPTWPTVVPTYAVYDQSGVRVASGKMPPTDLARAVGSFSYNLRLGSGFDIGHYYVMIDWTIGGTAYREDNRFEVVAGGSINGGVVSQHFYRRPHADFVVGKLDSDQRVLARNPEE